MRYIGWGAVALALVALHHNSQPVNEALGGSWWWWLLVAAVLVYTVWSDLRASKKPPAEG
jgi:hypothetical protein